MFRRILIANRGEVAARVLRTCRRLGVQAVAVTTTADRDLSYLAGADEVVEIGGPRAYLDQDAILDAARRTRCAAVHPGWGFLAENATFAARCEALGLTFIGPTSATMRAMADKARARRTMRALGLPPVPGTDRALPDVDAALRAAEEVGYPVLLKALAGGGGRGMRAVRGPAELREAWTAASAEAQSAFGDGSLYLEHLVEHARHVEFQVLGDGRHVVVLGARECSVQRRHQKLVEEAPVPGLAADALRVLAERVAGACRAIRYRGAGTVEMLAEGEHPDPDRVWFLEMNTRLQVEHTVTEEITGLDLVEEQLRIAANEPLRRRFEGASFVPGEGHALECRLTAEDPEHDLRPVPGTLRRLRWPEGEGVRVDTHLAEGDAVSPFYDSLLAKLVTRGPDRAAAIARMEAALDALVVEGVPTVAPVLRRVLAHPDFRAGRWDTGRLERLFAEDAAAAAGGEA